MRVLLDTNIVLRSSQPRSPSHAAAQAATRALIRAGRTLCISSQTIYEFLAVATRPVAENGLGLAHADADAELERFLTKADVLYDSLAVAEELRRLVVAHQVTGKKVHDARLVALMVVHDITEVLTFNWSDFKRFSFISPLPPEDVERILAAS